MNIKKLMNDRITFTHKHHGGEIYNLKSSNHILDFSTNINPFFSFDLFKQSYIDSMCDIDKYPDSYSTELRKELINYFCNKININNLIVGAGSMDLISIFCESFIRVNDEIIISQPTFSEYAWVVKKNKGKIINVYRSPKDEFQINSNTLLEKITSKTKIIFICNPNNPNGFLDNPNELLNIIKNASYNGILVFLDEAFIDFTGESNSFLSYINHFDNLFISRTFTKFFGLAGLRIGYAVSSPEIIKFLTKFQNLWSVNSIAQNIAKNVLKLKKFVHNSITFFSKEIKFVSSKLNQIPNLKIYPTNCNFILMNLKKTGLKASELKRYLLEEGILIRDCSNFLGLDEYYARINIKTRDLNIKLLNSIQKIIT